MLLCHNVFFLPPKNYGGAPDEDCDFYENVFVWKKRVSQVLPPLTIVEGTVLDHFCVMFGECLQTDEGTTNTMETHAIDDIVLGPNGNIQCGFRCFILVSGSVLHRSWKDFTMYKMTENTVIRINFMTKKKT